MSTLIVENLKGPTTGSNANTITIPSGQTLDASSGTVIPSAGQIVQVQTTVIPETVSVSTNSDADTYLGYENSITPKLANSKILLNINGGTTTWGTQYVDMAVAFYRSVAGGSYSFVQYYMAQNNMDNPYFLPHSGSVLDTPTYSLGDQITYRWYGRSIASLGVAYFQYNTGGQRAPITWTAMEIAQ